MELGRAIVRLKYKCWRELSRLEHKVGMQDHIFNWWVLVLPFMFYGLIKTATT